MVSRLAVVMLAVVAASSGGARAQSPDLHATSDTGVAPGLSIISGTVYDSVAGAPLANALVQMRMESGSHPVFSATTDSAGTFRIANVPPGRYIATFYHPVLETLGLRPIMWRVEVRDSLTQLRYAVPSATTIWDASCPASTSGDSTGLVLGHVRDADTGMPLARSVVSASWRVLVVDARGPHTERRQIAATSNADGLYALCGVPAGGGVVMRAEYGATSSGVVEVAPPAYGILVRDFGVGSSATTTLAAGADSSAARDDSTHLPHGTARLVGTVHSADGSPLSDVDLVVFGSDARDNSDKNGRFTLSELPSGTYTLEARHVGFAPSRVIVDLASHRTTTVAVTLDKRVPVLSTVHVYGKGRINPYSLSGFFDRKQHRVGQFYTHEDIAKWHPVVFTDVFRMTRDIDVGRPNLFTQELVMRVSGFYSCRPNIYVNGLRLIESDATDVDLESIANVEDIAAIEVYKPDETPPQFRWDGKCGSVVIWTRVNPY